MSHQYVPNLGELCVEDARRDAVHVAVAPVVAGHDLGPGDHVGFFEDGAVGFVTREYEIGTVDPFLRTMVQKGSRFWLFLYPGTVTSLRHVWSHPAFKIKVPNTVEGGAE